jgi:hypothetical protein
MAWGLNVQKPAPTPNPVPPAEENTELSLFVKDMASDTFDARSRSEEIALNRDSILQEAKLLKKDLRKQIVQRLRDAVAGKNDPEAAKIDSIAKDIDAVPAQPQATPAAAPASAPAAAPTVAEVADILDKAAETKDDSILGQAQSMLKSLGGGAMSMVFRGYIQLQRMILAVWPGVDAIAAEGQLNALERMYGSWFGSAEMSAQLNEMLKSNNIKIVAGKEDDMGYVKLHGAWKAELKKKTDGKDEEEKALLTSKLTLDSYLARKIEAYVKKYPRAVQAGKEHRTTLMGIFLEQAPKTETVNVAAPTV